MSVTAFEANILDRWDAGASIEKIVAATGHDRQTVNKVLSLYARPEADGRAFAAMARAGSTALAAAIAATGRRYS